MGFADVSILEGGVQAWIEAGLPVVKNGTGQGAVARSARSSIRIPCM
jgi:3-mercaptopyruvate sulfurtransferase SseA